MNIIITIIMKAMLQKVTLRGVPNKFLAQVAALKNMLR